MGTLPHVIVVDDGSTDGTSDAIGEEFPEITILSGDGNLFWNSGMHWAFDHALKTGYEAYLWLNDDTILFPDSFHRLLSSFQEVSQRSGPDCVVVGSTKDHDGRLSYGGSISISRLRRFQYQKVWDAKHSVECHVMNGNCVLIPHCVVDRVGNIDPKFEHAMGDTDYALRVRAAGGRVFVAPGFIGECSNNPVASTFLDRDLSLKKRWKHINSRKGLPFRSWFRFTQRHGGILWPLYFAMPYIKVVLR
jgi:GT2 family glycosyltransferase